MLSAVVIAGSAVVVVVVVVVAVGAGGGGGGTSAMVTGAGATSSITVGTGAGVGVVVVVSVVATCVAGAVVPLSAASAMFGGSGIDGESDAAVDSNSATSEPRERPAYAGAIRSAAASRDSVSRASLCRPSFVYAIVR